MQPATANYFRGAAYGVAAVSIWAGWSAMTRLAVTTGLDAWDIPALRFGVAGLLLSPVLMRRGLALDCLGWLGLAGLIFGTGAPYALVVLFLVASLLTACYTVIIRQSKLKPLHAAALVSGGSLIMYAPPYIALRGFHLAEVPLTDLAVQVIFQGIVVTIISLVLYGRAVLILGASGGSSFGALVPALSALLAVPLVGEWPTISGWGGIILISAGVYLASGEPLPVLTCPGHARPARANFTNEQEETKGPSANHRIASDTADPGNAAVPAACGPEARGPNRAVVSGRILN